jgi:hypothetical protein
MDRFLKIWVESARVSSSFDESSNGNSISNSPPTLDHGYLTRPPPLRTSSTYDDDEAFNNVALNLLSRYETLGLTAQEAILATLFDHGQRASFYEALCIRLDRFTHLSPNTTSLVQCVQEKFEKVLKEMILSETKGAPYCYTNKPVAPRGNIGCCRNMKQLVQRRFFPEGGGDKQQSSNSSNSNNNSILFGSSKRRVQNIDWKMAEAIQQVHQLRLDGMSPIQQPNHPKNVVYEPPTTNRGI